MVGATAARPASLHGRNGSACRTIQHGDDFEKAYWPVLLEPEFPQYAAFWSRFVRPLREDPDGIRLRREENSRNLTQTTALSSPSCTTRLSCTWSARTRRDAIRRPSSFRQRLSPTYPGSTHASRAPLPPSSATDTADELITRMRDDSYFAWDERKSQAARLSRRIPVDPMQPLHRYRNRLMHGPVIPHSLVPVIDASGDTAVTLTLPRLDKVRDVLDWRSFQHGEVDAADYAPAHSIFDHAWTDVMAYLRSEWRGMLGSAPGQAEAP